MGDRRWFRPSPAAILFAGHLGKGVDHRVDDAPIREDEDGERGVRPRP